MSKTAGQNPNNKRHLTLPLASDNNAIGSSALNYLERVVSVPLPVGPITTPSITLNGPFLQTTGSFQSTVNLLDDGRGNTTIGSTLTATNLVATTGTITQGGKPVLLQLGPINAGSSTIQTTGLILGGVVQGVSGSFSFASVGGLPVQTQGTAVNAGGNTIQTTGLLIGGNVQGGSGAFQGSLTLNSTNVQLQGASVNAGSNTIQTTGLLSGGTVHGTNGNIDTTLTVGGVEVQRQGDPINAGPNTIQNTGIASFGLTTVNTLTASTATITGTFTVQGSGVNFQNVLNSTNITVVNNTGTANRTIVLPDESGVFALRGDPVNTTGTGLFGNIIAGTGVFSSFLSAGGFGLTGTVVNTGVLNAVTGTLQNLNVVNSLNVQGTGTVNGTLFASGGITGSTATFTNSVIVPGSGSFGQLFGNSLMVSGTGAFSKTLFTPGGITGSTATFNNSLIVNGTGTFGGILFTPGGITGSSATFSNSLIVNGTGTFSATLFTPGGITGSTATLNNSLIVNGTGTFGGLLSAPGGITGSTATLNNSLIVNGTGTFGGLLSIPGGITGSTATLNNSLIVNGTGTFGGLLSVPGGITGGTATLNNSLIVNGTGTFGGLLSVPGGITGGTATLGTTTITGSNTLGIGTNDTNANFTLSRFSGGGPPFNQAMSMSTAGVTNIGSIPLVYNYGFNNSNSTFQSAIIITDALSKGYTGLFFGQSQNFARLYSDGAIGVNGPIALGTTTVGQTIGVSGSLIPIFTKLYGSATAPRNITFPDSSGTLVVSGGGGTGAVLTAPFTVSTTAGSTGFFVGNNISVGGALVRTFNNTVDDGNGNMVIAGTSQIPLQVLNPSMANNTFYTIFLGQANSTNNAGFVQYSNPGGTGSSSNFLRLGVIGNQALSINGLAQISTQSGSLLDDGTGKMSIVNTFTSTLGGTASSPLAFSVLEPNLSTSNFIQGQIGASVSVNDALQLQFQFIGTGSSSNIAVLKLPSSSNHIKVSGGGQVSSANNVFDDGSGNINIAGSVGVGSSTAPDAQFHWDITNGIQLLDKVNNNKWLYQAGIFPGFIRTLNNVLDDGSGNSTAQGTGTFSTVKSNYTQNPAPSTSTPIGTLNVVNSVAGAGFGVQTLARLQLTQASTNGGYMDGGVNQGVGNVLSLGTLDTPTVPSLVMTNGNVVKTAHSTLDDGSGNTKFPGLYVISNGTGGQPAVPFINMGVGTLTNSVVNGITGGYLSPLTTSAGSQMPLQLNFGSGGVYTPRNVLDNGSGNVSIGLGVSSPTLGMCGTTSNTVIFNNVGVNVPTLTTRSAGTKLVLFPQVSGSSTDYAMGISTNTLWSSVPTNTTQFQWFAGTGSAMLLTGQGSLATTSASGASRNLLDDGSGNVSLAGTLTATNATSLLTIHNTATTTSGTPVVVANFDSASNAGTSKSEVLIQSDNYGLYIRGGLTQGAGAIAEIGMMSSATDSSPSLSIGPSTRIPNFPLGLTSGTDVTITGNLNVSQTGTFSQLQVNGSANITGVLNAGTVATSSASYASLQAGTGTFGLTLPVQTGFTATTVVVNGTSNGLTNAPQLVVQNNNPVPSTTTFPQLWLGAVLSGGQSFGLIQSQTANGGGASLLSLNPNGGGVIFSSTGTQGAQFRSNGDLALQGSNTNLNGNNILFGQLKVLQLNNDTLGGMNVGVQSSTPTLQLNGAVQTAGNYYSDTLVGDAVIKANGSSSTLRIGTTGTASVMQITATNVSVSQQLSVQGGTGFTNLPVGISTTTGNTMMLQTSSNNQILITGNGGTSTSLQSTINTGTTPAPLFLNPTGSSVHTKNNTLDDSSGNMTVNGNETINAGSNGIALAVNSTLSAGSGYIQFLNPNVPNSSVYNILFGLGTNSRSGTLGYNVGSTGTADFVSLTAFTGTGITISGSSVVSTAHNTLDDSSGNMTTSGFAVHKNGGFFQGFLSPLTNTGLTTPFVQVGSQPVGAVGPFIQSYSSDTGTTATLQIQPFGSQGVLLNNNTRLTADGSGALNLQTTAITTNALQINGFVGSAGSYFSDVSAGDYVIRGSGTGGALRMGLSSGSASALRITSTAVNTLNNIVDDGSGNTFVSGTLFVNSAIQATGTNTSAQFNGFVGAKSTSASTNPAFWFSNTAPVGFSPGGNAGMFLDSSGAIGLNAGAGGVYTLNNGTKHNTLDNGSGGMTVAGTFSGSTMNVTAVFNSPTNTNQLNIADSANTNQLLILGTSNAQTGSFIQSTHAGIANNTLWLNSVGGAVRTGNNILDDGAGGNMTVPSITVLNNGLTNSSSQTLTLGKLGLGMSSGNLNPTALLVLDFTVGNPCTLSPAVLASNGFSVASNTITLPSSSTSAIYSFEAYIVGTLVGTTGAQGTLTLTRSNLSAVGAPVGYTCPNFGGTSFLVPLILSTILQGSGSGTATIQLVTNSSISGGGGSGIVIVQQLQA